MLFLDTEFTDLLDPELLSIGMVSIEGAEFYVELDMTSAEGRERRVASSDFVQFGGVLDLWGLVPGSAASSWEMGRRVGEWILGHLADASPQARTSIAFDYSVDYELLEYAIRDAGFGTGFERLSARATSTA